MSADAWVARYRLRALAALLVLWLAIGLQWNWPWGVWFLVLTVSSIRLGQTELVEVVRRGENPVVFWLIAGTWLLVSLALIAFDLLPLAGVNLG